MYEVYRLISLFYIYIVNWCVAIRFKKKIYIVVLFFLIFTLLFSPNVSWCCLFSILPYNLFHDVLLFFLLYLCVKNFYFDELGL